jgi:hypothetical protein
MAGGEFRRRVANGVAKLLRAEPARTPTEDAGGAVEAGAARMTSYRLWGGWLLVAALVVVGASVYVATNRAPTPLESALLGGFTFVLSLLGAALVSAFYSERQARAEYQQLARPALRRTIAIEASTRRIAESLSQRRDDVVSNKAVAAEWVRGFEAQLMLLIDQMGAATADWRELLPEDYQAARNTAAELAELRAEMNRKTTELEEAQRATQEAQGAGVKREQQRIRDLTKQIDDLRAQLARVEDAAAGTIGISSHYPFIPGTIAGGLRYDPGTGQVITVK